MRRFGDTNHALTLQQVCGGSGTRTCLDGRAAASPELRYRFVCGRQPSQSCDNDVVWLVSFIVMRFAFRFFCLQAKELCDQDVLCRGFGYSALGAVFKATIERVVPYPPASMLSDYGVEAPATFYSKSPCDAGRRLRLAFVHYYLPRGGVETIILSLARQLDRRCFSVSVVLVTDWMRDGGPLRPVLEALGVGVEMWPVPCAPGF